MVVEEEAAALPNNNVPPAFRRAEVEEAATQYLPQPRSVIPTQLPHQADMQWVVVAVEVHTLLALQHRPTQEHLRPRHLLLLLPLLRRTASINLQDTLNKVVVALMPEQAAIHLEAVILTAELLHLVE